MAGLGRRTHYRKHLTDSVLHDLPEPNFESGERIAKVVATRGSNQFDILVAAVPPPSSSEEEDNDDTTTNPRNYNKPQLAILPTKFRKLVWVKRNDYVMVQAGEEEEDGEDDSGGIRYMITHILYKEQVKHLKAKNLWPKEKEFQSSEEVASKQENQGNEGDRMTQGNTAKVSNHAENSENEHDEQVDDDDGIVYDAGYDDDDFLINTNRIATLQIQDSESESSDGEE